MTYVSGNTSKVESMSLPRKALKPDSKVIIIDDFMRGGGTIKGMIDLMNEFGAEVVGTGVFISTTNPEEKNGQRLYIINRIRCSRVIKYQYNQT